MLIEARAELREAFAALASGESKLVETLALALAGQAKKGDVFGVARVAGIMAAKKKEIRKASLPDGLTPSQQIVSLAVPTRSKQTQMIQGTPADAARELVRRLREEAGAL